MFTIPRPNLIQSDEGFSVEVLGRTGVRYEDDVGAAVLDGEVLSGPSGFMVYRDSVKAIHASTPTVSDTRRDQIIENVRRAFAFRGFDIEVY